MNDLADSLKKAICRRDKLLSITNALRLVNGAGDGLDGLLIDRYHRHIHVQMLSREWLKRADEICHVMTGMMAVDFLIVKIRHGLEVQKNILVGSHAQTTVTEQGLKFEVNLDDGLNCGLFLDMRRNRLMVKEAGQGKKVLNCFAYTCSFGVYARTGGAKEVVNTDISQKTLDRGRVNYGLNGIRLVEGEMVRGDVLAYLKRAIRKENIFDMIILDPPSFARYENKVFQVKRDLPQLISMAGAVLNPGGRLLVSTNFSGINHAALKGILVSSLKGRGVSDMQSIGQDDDFTGSNSFKESFLVGLWVKCH